MQKKFALCWGLLTSFLKWQKTLAFYSGKEFEASMFKSTYYHQTSSDLSITSSCMIIIEIESGIKKNLCFSSMKWIFLARNLNSRHIYIFLYIIWWIHCTVSAPINRRQSIKKSRFWAGGLLKFFQNLPKKAPKSGLFG